MHALVLDRPGQPDTLRPAGLPIPDPGPGQVRLLVEACGLDPVDFQPAAAGHPDWSVRQLTDGRGVDAAIDTIGSDSATANLRLLAHGGGIAAVAGRPDLSAIPAFSLAPTVHEIALGAAYTHGDERARADLAAMLADLMALAADRRLDPMVTRTVALDEVPAALTELAGQHVRGKLVATLTT